MLYLDDGVFAAHGEKETNEASHFVQDTLVKAGLLANGEKSIWVPSRLGFIIDLYNRVVC